MSVTFGKLQDLPLRNAWTNEARDFTPWLAENIDHIAEAIGVPLELTGQEVAVETFSADILARNPADGTVVLIENQLEQTDHTHLGQIMTYLAGLEAQTVVWIAPAFREPHLSAIRWLNEHTADGFAFFAVRLRVVRIGDSPYAPVFEVVEKPNDWERDIKQKASSEGSSYYDVKQEFWTQLLSKHPGLSDLGFKPWRYSNNYINVHESPVIQVAAYLARHESGLFVRSGWGEPAEPVRALLDPHRDALESQLDATYGPHGRGDWLLLKKRPEGHEETGAWPSLIDWMHDNLLRYRTALATTLKGEARA